MKKAMVNILFTILCLMLFAFFLLAGALAGATYRTNKSYDYLKVNFTSPVGRTVPDLTYGDKPLNNYDLYLPADDSREAYSLVFYTHGGGFTGGDKGITEAKRYGQYLASQGYVVASVNYSLSDGTGAVTIRDMYDELMSAVPVVVHKAEELGYHITEMAATGCSAGGCLAMLVAFKEPEKLPVPIKFVFEQTGPASFDPVLWGSETAEDKANFINALTDRGFTAADVDSEEFVAAWSDISAAAYVNENTVPILLAYGPNDKMVAVNAKLPLLDALDEYGVIHTYIEFPNSGHALLGDPDKTEEYYATMEQYLDTYFENKRD